MWLPVAAVIVLCSATPAASLSCVQCSSGTGTNVSHCVTTLPKPKLCPSDMTHCLIVKEYRNLGVRGTEVLMEVTRTCIGADLGSECDEGRTTSGINKKLCTSTCSGDGCNVTSREEATLSTVLSAATLGILYRNWRP